MKAPLILFLLLLPEIPPQDGILDRAIRHYEEGKYAEAVELLASSGKKPEVSAEAKFWLGKSYLKIREWDKAVHAFEKAVQVEPSNPVYRLWLGRAYGFRAENRILGFNDARRLLKEFTKAAELDPDNLDVRFDLLEFYAQAPGIVGGGEDKAWTEAERISKLNPLSGFTARATIYEHKKMWDPAKKELAQATFDFPNEANAHKDLALFLFNREDYEGALKSAQKALELDSLSVRSRLIATASRIRLGDCSEETLKTLLNLVSGSLRDEDPTFEEVYYWTGECYLERSEKEKARDAFKSALSYNSDYEKAKKSLDNMK